MKIYWWVIEEGFNDELWQKTGVHAPEMVHSVSDLEQMIRNGYTEISTTTARRLGWPV